MELHTDDYEAMPAPMASPRAPSAWPGHMHPGMQQGITRTGVSHPAAPNSLAPMAMGSSRGFAPTTDRGHQEAPKGRPDFRMGVMIALAGAMIGGTLGVAMNNAHRNDRAAAASSAPALPPTQAMNTLPPQQQMPAQTAYISSVGAPMQPQMQQPQVVPTTAFTAVAVTGDTKPTTDKPGKGGRGGHATISKPQPQKPQGGRVSVATNIPDSTPPAPPPKKDPPPKKGGGGGGGSTEADLLREAISEGGNSLGGSK